jgi:spermidine synthase
MRILIMVILALACGLASTLTDARVVHRERSLYNTILVDQRGSLLCLKFSIRRNQRNQSCVDTRKPNEMVFAYTRMMMASLLLQPEPARILIIGLGGGTLPTALARLFPEAVIHVVEIDPAVATVARDFFGFEPTANIEVFTQDARVFTKRAGLRGDTYDLIMLDAFNGDYIPEHLMTREYLEETQRLMSDDAVVVANTFSISQLYHHESTTYQAVFGTFFNLKSAASANRIILATSGELPAREVLQQRAHDLGPRLRRFGVKPDQHAKAMKTKPDWDTSARVLTDQYSPANLLQGR